MAFTVKDWKDRPVVLNPLAGETPAEWETRAAAYIAANPSLVTLIDAAAMEDVEGRLSAHAETLRPAWLPVDNALLAGTTDPANASAQIDTQNGEILWSKVWIPSPVTITNLVVTVSSPGSGFSAGNFGGLLSASGVLIAKTASQSTNWATAQTWVMPLIAEAGQSLTMGGVYVKPCVMSRATTRPLFRCELVDEAVNLNLTGLGLRSGSDSSDGTRTALPTTITAGNQAPTFRQVWFGLS